MEQTTKRTPAELIDEAREKKERLSSCFGMIAGTSPQSLGGLLGALADALEAATFNQDRVTAFWGLFEQSENLKDMGRQLRSDADDLNDRAKEIHKKAVALSNDMEAFGRDIPDATN